MRFMVFRARTGEWLDRDLPNVRDFECAEVLSGPGRLSFTVDPEQQHVLGPDGLRVLEDWGSMVLAVDEDSWDIVAHGIVIPPTGWENERVTITCMGVAGYPEGFIYENTRNWGPKTGTGTIANPEVPRPDPVVIFRDLWDYVQSFPNSDLGVVVTGSTRSNVQIGDYEEPYRLRWWESPDVGSEMNTLASETPFDYRERAYWTDDTHTAVRFEVEVGWPRLGTPREDLAFQLGVNIIEPSTPETVEEYANNFLGIGNGEGSPRPVGETSGGIVNARISVDDGRLRRTFVYTDKTIKDTARLTRLLRLESDRMRMRSRIGDLLVRDHPHAPLSSINVGDDIYVETWVPSFGEINSWVRVIEKARGNDPSIATLAVDAPGIYSPANPTDLEPSYKTPMLVMGGTSTDLSRIVFDGPGSTVQVGDWVFITGMGNAVTAPSDPRFTLIRQRKYAFPWWLNGNYSSFVLHGKLTTLDPLTIPAGSGNVAWVAVRNQHPVAYTLVDGDNAYSVSDAPDKDGPNTGPAITAPPSGPLSTGAVFVCSANQGVTTASINDPSGWIRAAAFDSDHVDHKAFYRGDGPLAIPAWTGAEFWIGAEFALEADA